LLITKEFEMAAATKSKTEKMLGLLEKQALTIPQITQRCGFAGQTSVTSIMSAYRKRGYNFVEKGTTRDGLTKYALA
jgi:hypothetical protein